MHRGAAFSTLLFALLSAGCAISPTPDLQTFARSSGDNSFELFRRTFSSPNALVLPVMHDAQHDGASCGAHVLASVVNYWRGPGTVSGDALYRQSPPQNGAGYSMAELLTLARAQGLMANAVRLPDDAIKAELESGRPVLVPVRLPSIYVQRRTLPGRNAPVIGFVGDTLISRTARVSELTGLTMVNHYLLIVGYSDKSYAVVEPVMGYRTISFEKLGRYRAAFGDAAIVLSGAAK